MRYKASLVRKVTLVNQYLRVFSGTGTRFRSREQLIPVPVPGLPVAALSDSGVCSEQRLS